MEKFNNDISELIFDLFESKIIELSTAFSQQLKQIDWASDESRQVGYVKIQSFTDILSDCIESTQSKIVKKSCDFSRTKDKEVEPERTVSKRRSQIDVRE